MLLPLRYSKGKRAKSSQVSVGQWERSLNFHYSFLWLNSPVTISVGTEPQLGTLVGNLVQGVRQAGQAMGPNTSAEDVEEETEEGVLLLE